MSEDSWTRSSRNQAARIHDLFWQRDSEVLTNPGSTEADLLKFMEGIGHYSSEDREALAQLLIVHPAYSNELARKAIENLKVQWWGDNPMECSNGCRTLEALLDR